MEIQKQGIGQRIWGIFPIPATCKDKKNMAVALYARVSTTKEAEKDLSTPDQLKQMREWYEAEGLAVAEEYVEPSAQAANLEARTFTRWFRAESGNYRVMSFPAGANCIW